MDFDFVDLGVIVEPLIALNKGKEVFGIKGLGGASICAFLCIISKNSVDFFFLGFLAFFHVEAGGSSFMERVFGGFVSVHLIWKIRGVRVGILKRN